MNEEKIKEIFSDEEFVKEFFGKETPEEAQAMLAEKDIDVTVEELCLLRDMLVKKLNNADSDAELCDDDLEDVAGGMGPVVATVIGLFLIGSLVVGLVKGIAEESGRRW